MIKTAWCQKIRLIMITASAWGLLSACQPSLEDHQAPDDKNPASEPATTPNLAEAKTPKALTKALIALSEENLENQLICTKLSDTIAHTDNKNTIEEVRSIGRQLSVCLPKADPAQRLEWLFAYQAMYARFLDTDYTKDGEMISRIARHIASGKVMTVAQLKQVTPRSRYLLGLVRSHDEISLKHKGAGSYVFTHDLKATADLFAPHLPADQAAFIGRMAKDNQSSFLYDGVLMISVDELIARASFWEAYIKQYPDSYFIDDARYLFDLYRYVLFLGSERTRWLDKTYRKMIDPHYKWLLVKLIKRRDSLLAKDAQRLFAFMNLSDDERHARYPVADLKSNHRPSTEDSDNANNTADQSNSIADKAADHTADTTNHNKTDDIVNEKITRYQLSQALQIPAPQDTALPIKDCFSGMVCTPNS